MNNLEKDQILSTEPQNEAQEAVNEEVKVEEPVAEPAAEPAVEEAKPEPVSEEAKPEPAEEPKPATPKLELTGKSKSELVDMMREQGQRTYLHPEYTDAA